MKRLLQLFALVLVFFLLAFSLGFVRATPSEGALSLSLGELSLYISKEALSVLGQSLHSVETALDAIPSYIALGLEGCEAAMEEVVTVFRMLFAHQSEHEDGVTEVFCPLSA